MALGKGKVSCSCEDGYVIVKGRLGQVVLEDFGVSKQICNKCWGEGWVVCPTCDGTGTEKVKLIDVSDNRGKKINTTKPCTKC